MSTTVDGEVARSYANSGGVSTVMEMQMGMVDRGGDLSLFSQYPHEKEICFPPLTGIEVTSTAVDLSTLVVNARLSVNLAALPLQDVIGKRGKMVRDMCSNLKGEVKAAMRVEAGTHFEHLGEYRDVLTKFMCARALVLVDNVEVFNKAFDDCTTKIHLS